MRRRGLWDEIHNSHGYRDSVGNRPTPINSGVFIIIPVHNRRETTLRCLARLADDGLLDLACVVVVDDGSTDGTAAAIARAFPAVKILPGNGNLWWTGAIALGMQTAMDLGAKVLVWLNDDCRPAPGALALIAAEAAATGGIALAQAHTPTGYVLGGVVRRGWRFLPVRCEPGANMGCDSFAGNCVAIARPVVERIGLPDACRLPHSLADRDYGLRATAAGFSCRIIGAAGCENDDNFGPQMRSWLLGGVPLGTLWRAVLSRRSLQHPPTAWAFHVRHFGPLVGPALFAAPYARLLAISLLRLLIPAGVLRALHGRRSAAWRAQTAIKTTGR